MLLIWKGRGWIVAIFYLLAFPFANGITKYMSLIDHYQYETFWFMSFTMIYAGIFIKTFFVHFPQKTNEKYMNCETKEVVIVKHNDSFFWIDVNIWAYVSLIIGIIVLFIALLNLIL